MSSTEVYVWLPSRIAVLSWRSPKCMPIRKIEERRKAWILRGAFALHLSSISFFLAAILDPISTSVKRDFEPWTAFCVRMHRSFGESFHRWDYDPTALSKYCWKILRENLQQFENRNSSEIVSICLKPVSDRALVATLSFINICHLQNKCLLIG